MSLLEVDFGNLKETSRGEKAAWSVLKSFLKDMDDDRSSFFHLSENSTWSSEFKSFAPEIKKRLQNKKHFLHLGIGGSSLGAEAMIRALAPKKVSQFSFLDNIDPDYLQAVLDQIEPEATLVYVVSKSGSTMETLAQFAYIYSWLEKKLGSKRAKESLVFCTDSEKGDLRALSKKWSVPAFEIPKNLGGRFSALSAVGFFPAYFAGIQADDLLSGAAQYRKEFLKNIQQETIPQAAHLAFRLVDAYLKEHRNITVLLPYSQLLKSFSAWFVQLWAESLGKDQKGMSPVAAVGPTDQHSILQLLRDGPQDKVVGFIEILKFNHELPSSWAETAGLKSFQIIDGISLNALMNAELQATRAVLLRNKRPYFSVVLPKLNASLFGQLMYFFEVLTAVTGYDLGINPFDQPGVEEGKVITQKLLGKG